MAASFTLTLDTAAPVVDWGTVQRHPDRVVLPYTIDEPAIVSASATVDGQPAETVASGSDVTITVPELWQALDLTVGVRDEVLNEAVRGLHVTRGVARLGAAVLNAVAASAGRVLRGRGGSIARGTTGRIGRPRLGGAG